jgi:hypothetical protein
MFCIMAPTRDVRPFRVAHPAVIALLADGFNRDVRVGDDNLPVPAFHLDGAEIFPVVNPLPPQMLAASRVVVAENTVIRHWKSYTRPYGLRVTLSRQSPSYPNEGAGSLSVNQKSVNGATFGDLNQWAVPSPSTAHH